jgi:NAD(P)H-flavin reductase
MHLQPVVSMLPRPFRIAKVTHDLSDTFTVTLHAEDGAPFAFRPGQFNMLYVFGAGEVPISISGDSADPSSLVHTVRMVGPVTRAMGGLKAGGVIGVRGPFGTPWPVAGCYGDDLLIVAGGVGLAPLRPAIYQALAEREKFGRLIILYGARSPKEMLFSRELGRWRSRFDVKVRVTVDHAGAHWGGHVGVVTKLITDLEFDRQHGSALICGPEVMMRHAVDALEKRGLAPERIHVSMERNMKCAVGLCGHCQWGPHFVCRDGPVFRFADIARLFPITEL